MTASDDGSAVRGALHTTLALAAIALAIGCGHTEEEWGWQQDKLVRAQGDVAAANGKLEQMRTACEIDRRRAVELAQRAEGGAPLSATLEERERANAEFRQRQQAAVAARAAAEILTKKLADLAADGVTVGLKRQRVVITLPGDMVFSSFKGDQISKPGRAALKKIADAIKSEPALVNKPFEVAGYTDDGKHYDGQYKDALGVSAMHAREVVAAIVGAGPLIADRWSVAGYGSADPVAPNDKDENKKKNRRVEITMLADDAPAL